MNIFIALKGTHFLLLFKKNQNLGAPTIFKDVPCAQENVFAMKFRKSL